MPDVFHFCHDFLADIAALVVADSFLTEFGQRRRLVDVDTVDGDARFGTQNIPGAMIDRSHPLIRKGSKDIVNLSTRNPNIVSKLRNHNPALVNDPVRVETLKIERPSKPGTESAGSARTQKAQNGVIIRNVGNLRIFHDQKPIESSEQAGNSRSFQRQPERIVILQYVHLRHELSLGREVRGVTARARRQFLHFVRDHALKPGHTVASSQLDDSKGIEFRNCGSFSSRPVILCQHSFIIEAYAAAPRAGVLNLLSQFQVYNPDTIYRRSEQMFRRLFMISSIAAALAGTVALAQDIQGKQAGRDGAARQLRQRGAGRNARDGRMLERLQHKLNLSETQMNGMRALEETRKKEMESLRQEVQPKRQALRQLLQQPNPNPNEVGNAAIALKDTRGRIREINQRFTLGVKGLLTPDQLQNLPKKFQ
jgi:Spy/CpxP family protein refolding chaperone